MRIMYDAVDANAVPATGWDLLAGYVNGRYRSAPALRARFPQATVVTIDVLNLPGTADVLDVETGDATPAEAPGWFDQSKALGVLRPTIYCPHSLWPAVHAAMGSRVFDLWVASYGIASCPVPRAVAWQKIDRGPHGENVDVSEVYDPTWPHGLPNEGDDELNAPEHQWLEETHAAVADLRTKYDRLAEQVTETDAAVNRSERFLQELAKKEGLVYPYP